MAIFSKTKKKKTKKRKFLSRQVITPVRTVKRTNEDKFFQENLSFLAQGIIFILVGSLITIGDITGYLLQGFILTLDVAVILQNVTDDRGSRRRIKTISEIAGFGVGILGLVVILYYESHNINFRVIRKFLLNIISLNTVGMVVTGPTPPGTGVTNAAFPNTEL